MQNQIKIYCRKRITNFTLQNVKFSIFYIVVHFAFMLPFIDLFPFGHACHCCRMVMNHIHFQATCPLIPVIQHSLSQNRFFHIEKCMLVHIIHFFCSFKVQEHTASLWSVVIAICIIYPFKAFRQRSSFFPILNFTKAQIPYGRTEQIAIRFHSTGRKHSGRYNSYGRIFF